MLPDLDKICRETECQWGVLGLTGGFYDEYAKEVALKFLKLAIESMTKEMKQNELSPTEIFSRMERLLNNME